MIGSYILESKVDKIVTFYLSHSCLINKDMAIPCLDLIHVGKSVLHFHTGFIRY